MVRLAGYPDNIRKLHKQHHGRLALADRLSCFLEGYIVVSSVRTEKCRLRYRRYTMKGNEIQRLRQEGYGYVRIAQMLGLSENSVKSFCRRHPLPADDSHKQAEGVCPQCKAKVDSRRRFCSDACRAAWWNAHREHPNGKGQIRFICQYCKKPFAGYPAQNPKYCCHVCYIAARYGKGRENRG